MPDRIDVVPDTGYVNVVVDKQLFEVVTDNNSVEVVADKQVFEVVLAGIGPPGPPGAIGPQGPPGPPAGEAAGGYVHIQEVPDTVWVIAHNLPYRPAGIFVEDTSGSEVEGEVMNETGVVTITFTAAFAGRAYLS